MRVQAADVKSMLPRNRKSPPPPIPLWDEQDELDYIAQGEPLQGRSKYLKPPRAFGHPRQHTALLIVPFVFVVWVVYPFSQMVALLRFKSSREHQLE